MIITSEYGVQKIQRKIESKEAKIRGRFKGWNGSVYFVIDSLDRFESDMVPAACAPKDWQVDNG